MVTTIVAATGYEGSIAQPVTVGNRGGGYSRSYRGLQPKCFDNVV